MPPSVDPIEERIRQALLDRLRLIRKAGGYFTDLGEGVLERRFDPEQLNTTNLPAASCFAGNEVTRDGYSGSRYGSGCEFFVQVVIDVKEEDDLDALTSRVKADVKKVVLGWDMTVDLVRIVDDVEWGGAGKELVEIGPDLEVAVVNLQFIALFDWTPDAA